MNWFHVKEDPKMANKPDAILGKITKKAAEYDVEVVEHLLTADALRDMKFIVKQNYILVVTLLDIKKLTDFYNSIIRRSSNTFGESIR